MADIQSPLPGAFYRKPAPEDLPFKSPGDAVAVGDTIGLIELMKTFIEIKAEIAGLFEGYAAKALGITAIQAHEGTERDGAVNGIGVAYFDVSPFIMTLGVSSVGAGLALFLTGGVPVSGLPFAFGDTFGFGRLWGIPVPVVVAVICIAAMWIFMSRTRLGTQVYAVGGNIKAAHLSAINTKRTLMLAYTICALIASLTGLLLIARVESGEASLGGTIALESIAACVIAGVSLRGGIGRVENVVLGGFFIVLVQNGMNLARVSSYMQMVLLGALLILAVIFDQLRYRIIMGGR